MGSPAPISFSDCELTQDPSCRIESRGVSESGVPFVVYQSEGGERWRINGECNQCGECWAGSVGGDIEWTGVPIGSPGAFVDLRPEPRLDCPVTPGIKQDFLSCALSGEYL